MEQDQLRPNTTEELLAKRVGKSTARKPSEKRTQRSTANERAAFPPSESHEVTHEEYLQFFQNHASVIIEGINVQLAGPSTCSVWGPPEAYEIESTTVWSFPDRGDWATHRGNYRGNWSPYVPRTLIERYTKPGELVLDQMCGSGTTLVESRLLGRPAVGVDANPDAVMVSRDRLAFTGLLLPETSLPNNAMKTYVGDARHLGMIHDETVELVATHPPYIGIVQYGRGAVPNDLSAMRFAEYFEAMKEVARESMRVLAPGGHCAILIGDSRQHQHYVPISTRVMELFLDAGFILREEIIKLQWNMKATRERWRGRQYNFLKIAHEHLLVFRKPIDSTEARKYRRSIKW